MTATAQPPRAPSPAVRRGERAAGAPPPRGGAGSPTGGRVAAIDPTLPATLALTAVTLSVTLGFGRLFGPSRWVFPMVAAAIVTHAVTWILRRRGVPVLIAFVASLAAATLVGLWAALGHTTAYGLPTPHTFRSAIHILGSARARFADVRAPAPVLPGFLFASIIAVGTVAALADWAAFRINAAFEACIPAFTVFLFTAALGTDRHRVIAVAGFVLTVLTFLLAHQLGRQRRQSGWFGGRTGGGLAALGRTGVGLAVVALAGGVIIGPRLPGAKSAPVLKYRNQNLPGNANRSTISPLVDIRGRLVEHSNLEVFTVKTNTRAYWRLMSLDSFNGSYWSSEDKYDPAKGRLGTGAVLRPDLAVTAAAQDYTIEALAAVWLPAAFRPVRITGIKGATFDPDSASLVTDKDSTDGATYHVDSSVPDFTPQQLATAPATVPTEIAARYLQLPAISPRVVAEARRVTGRASTQYGKAKALQDYFRSGAFTYDLNARPGHDTEAIERFLFRTKRGYCEQFAGAYGVMARAIGLPTRIAVGFTPGDLRDDGLYHVLDQHAHAWPEVYLHGFGWVAFEPTPGRGMPGAQDYTGVVEHQEGTQASTGVNTPTSTNTSVPTASSTTPTSLFDPSSPTSTAKSHHRSPWLNPYAVGLYVGLALVGLWALVLPLLYRQRRVRRWRRAVGPAGRVHAAWLDVLEIMGRAGIHRRPAETHAEYARRAGRSAGLQTDANRALAGLARDAAAAAYAGFDLSDDAVDRASTAAADVERAVNEQLTRWERWRTELDPRGLLRPV